MRPHTHITNRVVTVFFYDDSIFSSVDLYALGNAYNEYTQLLIFVEVNKDNISSKLYDRYVKRLGELLQKLDHEVDNTLTVIKEIKGLADKGKGAWHPQSRNDRQ